MAFTLSVTFPFDLVHLGKEFGTVEAVRECAQAAEKAGFWSGTVTDHPAPSARWLDAGGHYAQDPFVMLSMVAMATTRLRVQSNIIVLPYRNPFVTARAVSSLDAFSGGRVVLGMGAGYLKAEYKALGADFESRNDVMDEYIRAMKLAWTGEDFTFEGTGYTALGNRILPAPEQKPHPLLLIGGNSKRALRRAAEHGDAWHPVLLPKIITQTSRTANLSSDDDIREAIGYMHAHSEAIGRSVPPKVLFSSTFTVQSGWSAQEALDRYASLRSLGVAGSGANIIAESRSEWCDQAARFGEEVIARLD